MYLSTSIEDFPEMYLSTFQVLYKLYLSTDVLKYKVLLPSSDHYPDIQYHGHYTINLSFTPSYSVIMIFFLRMGMEVCP